MDRPLKIGVVLNPQSKNGDPKRLAPIIKERFGHSLMAIEAARNPQQATHIAREAVKRGADAVVAVGGDGTVNGVINGIAGTDVALGIIPTGTANDLATLFHTPEDVRKACDIVLQRRLQKVDLVRVNDRYYITGGGLGLPCKTAQIANAMKRNGVGKAVQHIFGSHLYLLAAFYQALREAPRRNLLNMHLRWNGCSLVSDPLALMISNQAFIGKRFLIAPGASNDDGLFDICLIETPKSRSQIFAILLNVLAGKHVDSPWVKTWRATELTIDSDGPVAFCGDGEVFKKARRFKIEIFPMAINVITPGNR